jgi:hypothetical protein
MVTQTPDRVDIQAAPIAVSTVRLSALRLEIRSKAHAEAFMFIVTLLNRRTGDEQTFEITTLTDSFLSVLREIQWKRDELNLRGYDIFEVIAPNHNPF